MSLKLAPPPPPLASIERGATGQTMRQADQPRRAPASLCRPPLPLPLPLPLAHRIQPASASSWSRLTWT